MKKLCFSAIYLLSFLHSHPQEKVYSDPEKTDFFRMKTDVIARNANSILVYKATYTQSPNRQDPYRAGLSFAAGTPEFQLTNPGVAPIPGNSIYESAILIYDQQLKLKKSITLPLPNTLTGVHFLTYDAYFYMFYQYQRGHRIFCMAAKMDFKGSILGEPIELDHTDILDIHYQSQIYSVIFSEDKKHIMAFSINSLNEHGNELYCLSFDTSLNCLMRYRKIIDLNGADYLTEFKVDNEGNLIFLGMSKSKDELNYYRAVFFSLRKEGNNLTYQYFVPASFFTDDFRIKVDNRHRKYFLASLYTAKYMGDIKGLYALSIDAATDSIMCATSTIFENGLRRNVRAKGNLKSAFNDFYIQDILLRSDGGMLVELQELYLHPDRMVFNRWNYREYLTELVATNYVFYDPYEQDHYTPWNEWKYFGNGYSYSSKNILIASMTAEIGVEWIKLVNSPQLSRFYSLVGFKAIVANDLIYFIYNETIRGKVYLTAQSVGADGTLNPDNRLKEDMELKGFDNDYTYFPRMAKLVGPNEIMFPYFRGRGNVGLVKVKF